MQTAYVGIGLCRTGVFAGNLFDQPVGLRVGKNDPRLERFGFFEVHQRVRDDDHYVADYATARRRPVQAHGSAAALPFDDISFETFPI